jgi:hypothetical protein
MTEQEVLEQFWWYTKDMPEQQKETVNDFILEAYDFGWDQGYQDGRNEC